MKDNISDNPLAALAEIKKVMQTSTRIFSLSGWSGIWVGIIAIFGAGYIRFKHENVAAQFEYSLNNGQRFILGEVLKTELIIGAFIIFSLAVVGALFFSIRKNKKLGFQLSYNEVGKKLIIQLAIPIFVGAIFCFHFLFNNALQYLVPISLVFYGLGLINCSKYTFSDIKYLGLIEVILGVIALTTMQFHLLLWLIGFGILHIIYGIIMWFKFDRQ